MRSRITKLISMLKKILVPQLRLWTGKGTGLYNNTTVIDKLNDPRHLMQYDNTAFTFSVTHGIFTRSRTELKASYTRSQQKQSKIPIAMWINSYCPFSEVIFLTTNITAHEESLIGPKCWGQCPINIQFQNTQQSSIFITAVSTK